jgi:hypothetical protein
MLPDRSKLGGLVPRSPCYATFRSPLPPFRSRFGTSCAFLSEGALPSDGSPVGGGG